MSDRDLWLAANDRFLADELRALRRRLEALAGPAMPASGPHQRGLWAWLTAPFRSDRNRIEAVVETVAAPASEVPGQTPALKILAQRLGLSDFERQTLLLCAAMEFDTGTAGRCARAQRDPSRPWPSFGLALTAFGDPAWDILSPERPLRYWRLIEINQPGAQTLMSSALKADERIVNYIKGLNYLDDRMTPLVEAVALHSDDLPPSQASIAEAMTEQLKQAGNGAPLPVFQLLGSDGRSKRDIAGQCAAELGLVLYRLPAAALPVASGDNETFTRLWQREAALLPLALYIDALDLDQDGAAQRAAVQRFLDRSSCVTFLDTREVWSGGSRAQRSYDVAKPTPAEQYAAWQRALGTGLPISARLTGQFNLGLAEISSVAARALAGHEADPDGRDLALWQGCLEQARPALNQLAQAITPVASWDDIELPQPEARLLRQIADQVRNRMSVYDDWGFRDRLSRGLGISVLFAGDSGTGKTMAAEAMARELRLDLYRIDLSGVVSKYIGETEKNLRKLFDAAEDGGAILFFDEADALFGKRSEVKDSHDRYANIEINYLLQRMESYRGLAILTTNMKSSLDQAFMRRLRFIVDFPFPGPAERQAIWQKVFPPQCPLSGIDYARLARLNLTGGSIHNIALAAAFMAVEAGGPVTMPILLDAARAEYRKLEKPVSEADFRWPESVGGAP